MTPMTADASNGPTDFWNRYRLAPGRYDEWFDPQGRPRPHAAGLLQSFAALGSVGLDEAVRESQRLLKENGVTYNIYGDPHGDWRTWSFDPIPLILADEQWRAIEAGLVERANVWEAVLRDLYGPRSLIRGGVIPPEVVDGDPRYLRSVAGLRPIADRWLHLCAADVARRPDGTFVVLDDRTQSPSGAGYALENRLVLSRVFSDLYRTSQAHRLASFFRTMLASLSMLAPEEREEPRFVLLTPGPGNETYFEHAYLAHYLGLTLVEGSDLVVREQKVWLRTLDGLERVHVILRRIDDTYCDPLELRPDSVLGIPGLLSAIREGSVLVANPPGVGLCESGVMASYFPDLARAILGRDLLLPSARAWWCGRPEQIEEVLANLENVLIRPVRARSTSNLIRPGEMASADRERLAEAIRRTPRDYAAREMVHLSTAPVWINDALEPRELVLRAFLVGMGDSHVVMPGALTRVASATGKGAISNQEGGISKDTWITSPHPVGFVTLLPMGVRQVELRRSGGEIASRVAENLYWLGRYTERAEGTTRLMRTIVRRLLEARHADNDVCPPDLLRTLTHLTTTYPGFVGNEHLLDHPDEELLSLVGDSLRPGSLIHDLESLWRTARSTRDRLSDDMWRTINCLTDDIRGVSHLGDLVEPLDQLIVRLSALAGLVADSMTRGPGFWFVDFGRRIERAMATVNLLRGVFFCSVALEDAMAEALLEVADSVMTYRRRYKSRLHPAAVMDLLLTDDQNPRAVAYQLVRLHDLLQRVPSRRVPKPLEQARQLVMTCLGDVRMTDTDTLQWWAEDGSVRERLDAVLIDLQEYLRRASDAMSAAYFVQVELPRQLVEFA